MYTFSASTWFCICGSIYEERMVNVSSDSLCLHNITCKPAAFKTDCIHAQYEVGIPETIWGFAKRGVHFCQKHLQIQEGGGLIEQGNQPISSCLSA